MTVMPCPGEILYCEWCSKKMSPKTYQGGKRKRFCSAKCRSRNAYVNRTPEQVERDRLKAKKKTAERSAFCDAVDPRPRCQCCGRELKRRKGALFCSSTPECRHASYLARKAKAGSCSVPDCGRPVNARGMCGSHYSRWYRERHPDSSSRSWHAYRARKLDAWVEDVDKTVVLERDGWTCHLCGEPIPKDVTFPDPLYPSIDHVIPLNKGGEHSYSNCRAAHHICNSTKRDNLMEVIADAGTPTQAVGATHSAQQDPGGAASRQGGRCGAGASAEGLVEVEAACSQLV